MTEPKSMIPLVKMEFELNSNDPKLNENQTEKRSSIKSDAEELHSANSSSSVDSAILGPKDDDTSTCPPPYHSSNPQGL